VPRRASYRSQRDRGRGQSYEPAVARVRLVDGVGVLVAELVHDAGDALVVLRVEGIPDEALELEGAAFALVVELVVERLSDVRVHVGGSVCEQTLHGDAEGLSQADSVRGRGRSHCEVRQARFTCSLGRRET
jgi:hypothetical protein